MKNETGKDFFDEFTGESGKDANESFNPDPEMFSANFLEEVEQSLHESISLRRDLHGEQCVATNQIDKCWRCKDDWDKNRHVLAQCVRGFAQGTIGGSGGDNYLVTDPTDDDAANPKPGTLRFGVIQNKPLWIIFEKDMIITLKHELVLNKDKTIDGRGAKVEIANGAGITIGNVANVIVHGIHIHDIKKTQGGLVKDKEDQPARERFKSDGDGMTIFNSSKIWIDHCTLSNGFDGLIDVTLGSTAVTISNCKFSNHEKVMLLGADDTHEMDKNMQVTVALNKFDAGLGQRIPRCRWGFFHIINNDYQPWRMYAIVGSAKPTIISQGNRFIAPDGRRKLVSMRANATEEEWKQWNWRTVNDVFENGAQFIASGVDPILSPEQQQHMNIQPEPGSAVEHLTSCAGALSCTIGKPC
ncbi:pectin lyase fold/virulence factor, AmbAllergen [Artemisia annua]|uniref:Pectate lyase n=1 Tax=Artemisia annua TaxID=35608 RepID=A0A2U1MRH9_ARTAN|nr:pectin lyase fold/virulence factor, AmbAllergen [Artemisia annua]